MSFQTSDPSSYPSLSYADGIAAAWQDFLILVGRVTIGWIFLLYGWGKLFNIPGYAESFPRRGLAEWMAWIAVPVEFFGGLLLILGLATRYAVVVLFVFMIVASFSSHDYWNVAADAGRGGQRAHFWKNITIMGGMLVLFATAGGRFSLDRILRKS